MVPRPDEVSAVSRGVWTWEELEHDIRFPLSLQLPPVERNGERPIFRRAPRAMVKDAGEPGRWVGYFVVYGGAPWLLLEVERPKKSERCPYWALRSPTWSAEILRVAWDFEVLMQQAVRALLFAAAVDIPSRHVVAREEDWYGTGWVDVLVDAGWGLRSKWHNYLAPPEEMWWCSGDVHRQMIEAIWRHAGTGVLEETLVTFAATRALAERWEVDRYPGLSTALRNVRYGLKRTWRAWGEPKIQRWRIRRHRRQVERTERWMERRGITSAGMDAQALRELKSERDSMS